MRWAERHKILVAVVLLLIAFNAVFFYVTPDEIVEYIGVHNSYSIAFLIAAIGGVSTLTGATLFATIITFAAGGADPLMLGVAAGIGIFISNSVFFLLAMYGRKSVPRVWHERLLRIEGWVKRRISSKKALMLAYVYLGFTPFPDDILMFALVLSGYSYKRVAPVLLAGGVSLATLVAHLGNFWQLG